MTFSRVEITFTFTVPILTVTDLELADKNSNCELRGYHSGIVEDSFLLGSETETSQAAFDVSRDRIV